MLPCQHSNKARDRLVRDRDDHLALSLREICLEIIADNSSVFPPETITWLPAEILVDLKWHLSPHDLLKFSRVFERAGVETVSVWERHFVQRYQRRALYRLYFCHFETCISDVSCQTAKAWYLCKHCSDMLVDVTRKDNGCRCRQDLKFYLKNTPSLTLKWTKALSGRDMADIRNLIQQNVRHLHILNYELHKDMRCKLIHFLNLCSSLKSVEFLDGNLLWEYFRSFKEKDCELNKWTVDSIKLSLGEFSVKLLTSQEFPELKLTKLDIQTEDWRLYKDLYDSHSFCSALTNLTHLTVHGSDECMGINDMDMLFSTLLELFRIPSRGPLKVLKFVAVLRMNLTLDLEKYKGQSIFAEKVELLHCAIPHDRIFICFCELLLKNNTSLTELLFLESKMSETGIDTQLVHREILDICKQRKLKSLALPTTRRVWSIHQILSSSEELTLLNIMISKLYPWDPTPEPGPKEEQEEGVKSIACHKNLQTLTLEGTDLGENGCKLLELVVTSEMELEIKNICLRSCFMKGEDLIQTGITIVESASRRRLHVLDISMNKITRSQQTEIKKLYRTFTDILVIDIPDCPALEYVAQM